MYISKIVPQDLTEVVSMHVERIPYSISSQAGRARLLRLYSHFLKQNNFYSYSASDGKNGKLLGFITGITSLKNVFRISITTLRPSDFTKIAKSNLSLIDFLDAIEVSQFIAKEKLDYFYITAWCANSDESNKSVGLTLLKQIRDFSFSIGVNRILVDTRKSNRRALTKYQQFGFVEIKASKLSRILELRLGNS